MGRIRYSKSNGKKFGDNDRKIIDVKWDLVWIKYVNAKKIKVLRLKI